MNRLWNNVGPRRFNRLLFHWGILLVMLTAPTSFAADRPPVVLVCKVADSDPSRLREDRFITELNLALDKFRVLPTPVEGEPFTSLVLSDRLEKIRALSEQHDAVATVWIEMMGDDTLLLNLVAMSTGRALVRIVEIETGPSSEAELAFAAQELLGEAYLFSPESEEEAVRHVVQQVKQTVSDDEAESEEGVRLGIMPLFESGGGIYKHEGPSLILGGGLALMISIGRNLFVRTTLTGDGGPRERFDDGVLSGFGFRLGAELGYCFALDPLKIGPVIGASLQWRRLDMALGDGGNQSFSELFFRGDAGIDLQLYIRGPLYAVLSGGIGVYANRASFKRVSDRSIVLETPLIAWRGSIGLLIVL